MITKMYSVYDSKGEIFNVPFFLATTPMAVRAFGDLVNDASTTIHKHPEDYVLYEVGEFNDQTGETKAYKPAINLGIASQYKRGMDIFRDNSHVAVGDLQPTNGKEN